MALRNVPIPNFVSGVSQQPPGSRFPEQLALAENVYSSAVEQLGKRHPTKHVAKGENQKIPFFGHIIDRKGPVVSEQYQVLIGAELVKVYDLLDGGVEIPVHGPTGPSFTPDFSYLGLRRPNAEVARSEQTFINPQWAVSGDALPGSVTAVVGPYQTSTAIELKNTAVATSGGFYSQGASQFTGGDRTQIFTVFMKQGAGTPATQVGLRLVFTGTEEARFNISAGGVFTIDSVDSPMFAFLEEVGDGWYRLGIGGNTQEMGLVTGNNRTFRIDVQSDDVSPADKTVYAWGAFFEAFDDDTRQIPSYLEEMGDAVRALTISDSTFVLNRKQTVAQGITTAPADTDTGHAFIFVRQAAFVSDYTVTVTQGINSVTAVVGTWDGAGLNATDPRCVGADGGVGLGTQVTCEANGGVWLESPVVGASEPFLATSSTDAIAERMAELLTAAGAWLTATATGSIIELTSTTEFDSIELIDSAGNTLMEKIDDTVERVQDLPKVFKDNYRVKVVGLEDVDDPADDYYVIFVSDEPNAFGIGHWEEASAFELVRDIDATTMPHQLVRKQDDGVGTVTGIADQIYFEWDVVTWGTRLVGDDDSNPFPSFVDAVNPRAINDLFFHRGRFGLLADQNVILSEAGQFVAITFFRTSLKTLLASDPIDISSNHTEVAILRNARAVENVLICYSDRNEFILTPSRDPLTPESAGLTPILSFESLSTPSPITVGGGQFFAFAQGSFSGVRELVASTTDGEVFDPRNTSAIVPKYIEGRIVKLGASDTEGILLCLADGERHRLSSFDFQRTRQQEIQAGWSKMVFGAQAEVEIISMGFVESDLFLAIYRGTQLVIEKMRISDGLTDPNSDFLVHLDRKITDRELVSAVYTAGVGTVLTLPYDLTASETPLVVTRADPGVEGGVALQVTATDTSTAGAHTVTVDGDQSASPLFVGVSYLQKAVLSRPYLRTRGDRPSILAGRYQLLQLRLDVDACGYLEARVTPQGGRETVKRFSGPPVGGSQAKVETVALLSEELQVGIFEPAERTTVSLENPSHLGCNLVSGEWEVDFVPTSGRVGA